MSGIDRLLTQMQETGKIPMGNKGFDLGWLLFFLDELGIDPNTVYLNISDGLIEKKY